jgi:hypothetical protein
MMDFKHDPALRRILAENAALFAALSFVEDGGDPANVRKKVADVLLDHEALDLQSQTIHVAMTRIVGSKVEVPSVRTESKRHAFGVIARAWITWASGGNTDEALQELQSETISGKGAINLMALQPWAEAVASLLSNDLPEARRLFRRATEIGSQLGTEANIVIQWTYAATFFEHGSPPIVAD